MDILKSATDWTKAEMLSSSFFILFGLCFVCASLGFWRMGKTDMAQAYVIPAVIAGVLLLILGLGMFFQNRAALAGLAETFAQDAPLFIASEIERADKILNQYSIAVFKIFPVVIAVCAVLIAVLEAPVFRASLIVVIAMLTVILLVDTNANARLETYRAQLVSAGSCQ